MKLAPKRAAPNASNPPETSVVLQSFASSNVSTANVFLIAKHRFKINFHQEPRNEIMISLTIYK